MSTNKFLITDRLGSIERIYVNDIFFYVQSELNVRISIDFHPLRQHCSKNFLVHISTITKLLGNSHLYFQRNECGSSDQNRKIIIEILLSDKRKSRKTKRKSEENNFVEPKSRFLKVVRGLHATQKIQ